MVVPVMIRSLVGVDWAGFQAQTRPMRFGVEPDHLDAAQPSNRFALSWDLQKGANRSWN